MTLPNWKDALPAPPHGGRLQEGWLTSFEQPDASLLVEHFFPSLLDASHSLALEQQEQSLFFVELGMALEKLRGRLTVISSPSGVRHKEIQYPWLWRYVNHFTVGAQSRAVQHAKFWAFHWEAGDKDFLDLYVSSANLTTSAFKGQIQAGWRVCLPFGRYPSRDNRRSWGSLIPFLDTLGVSAGDIAATRIERLVALLSRVACPAGVTFIASIPGRKGAARQLGQFESSELHVLTPTIGDWKDGTLSVWSEDAGVVPGKIHLKWLSEDHPWAMKAGWVLSRTTSETLKNNGVQLECLPIETKLVEQHRAADLRWSHAKLYLLCNRRKRWLLVTSANWSVAAWGVGKRPPDNFELGVLFETEWTALEAIGKPFHPPNTVPFCVERIDEDNDDQVVTLEWAEAHWDGKQIEFHARSSDRNTRITAIVIFSQAAGTDSLEKRTPLSDGAAAIRWEDSKNTPLVARFTQGTEELEVDILDLRSPAEFAKTPMPEVDPDIAQVLREQFLLRRYGGPEVEAESLFEPTASSKQPDHAATAADYSVQAWLEVRTAFKVIDHWRTALARAKEKNDPSLFERVHLDGQELCALYARRQGAADSLAAEELGWRLAEKA